MIAGTNLLKKELENFKMIRKWTFMNKLNFNLCSFRPRSSHYDNSYRLWRESNIRQRVFWRKREKSVRDWRRRKTSKLYTDTVSCVWERDKSETGGGGRQVSYVLILCHVYQRERSVRHWRITGISILDMMM